MVFCTNEGIGIPYYSVQYLLRKYKKIRKVENKDVSGLKKPPSTIDELYIKIMSLRNRERKCSKDLTQDLRVDSGHSDDKSTLFQNLIKDIILIDLELFYLFSYSNATPPKMSKSIFTMNKYIFRRPSGGYLMCSTGRGVLPIDSLPNKIHANISLHLKLTLKFNMLIYVS